MADLDRLLREQNPEPGQPRIPVPQYQKVGGLGYEKVTGQHGGAHAVLLSPDGQPINSGNRLPVDTGLTNNLQIIADNQGRLYGSPDGGSTWKAVKVNSGGQLELAQNVVIDNVTVNVGAEVKVNNTPEDPVKVQPSGTITDIIARHTVNVTAFGTDSYGRRWLCPDGSVRWIPGTSLEHIYHIDKYDDLFLEIRNGTNKSMVFDDVDGKQLNYYTWLVGRPNSQYLGDVRLSLETIPAGGTGRFYGVESSTYNAKYFLGCAILFGMNLGDDAEGSITWTLLGVRK